MWIDSEKFVAGGGGHVMCSRRMGRRDPAGRARHSMTWRKGIGLWNGVGSAWRGQYLWYIGAHRRELMPVNSPSAKAPLMITFFGIGDQSAGGATHRQHKRHLIEVVFRPNIGL